jgi:hypothetical protein
VWRISSNLELQNLYKSPDIVTEIKIRRLEWLGHVIRMDNTHIPKIILNTKPKDRHGIGRHKLRWLDDVEADIKTLGTKRWRLKSQDSKEWTYTGEFTGIKYILPNKRTVVTCI